MSEGMGEFFSQLLPFGKKKAPREPALVRPTGTPTERIQQIPTREVPWAEFGVLQYNFTEQEQHELEQHLATSFESLAHQLQNVEWGNFTEADDILVLVSGKSSFIAHELFPAFKAFLPEDHPLRTKAHILQLGDAENAALYGKYSDHPDPYNAEKYQNQEKLRSEGLTFIEEKARERGLLTGSKKPTLVMFEEFCGSEGKMHNSLASLRKAGYDAYALAASGLPQDVSQNEKRRITFMPGTEVVGQYMLVGSRNFHLFDFMSLAAVLRSGFSARAHVEKLGLVVNSTKKERHTIRMARQAFRDLFRQMATNVIEQKQEADTAEKQPVFS